MKANVVLTAGFQDLGQGWTVWQGKAPGGRGRKAAILRLAAAGLVWLLSLLPAAAAPFAEKYSYTQPDGAVVQLWGEGDEFHAVFETLDGFTVVFDPQPRAYCYARPGADGDLESTGVWVGRQNPAGLGLRPHVRMAAGVAQGKARARRAAWEAGTGTSQRWAELKAEAQARGGLATASPPGRTTTGTKVGLCLLIDFDEAPGTIPVADVEAFCNSDSFSRYGNNGSVKKYFRDNSNGLLTYSNVVTAYIRIPASLHPRSYYDDTSKDSGEQGNLLIKDALDILKAQPNYESEILPAFSGLTTDAARQVLALNVFFAGDDSGVWSKGLWPHSWSLSGEAGVQELSPGGMKVNRYQITDLGTSLGLSTFCHENGHLLCAFPDIYDYGYDSKGGAGKFCLMGYGASKTNPQQFCAYLKNAAGWATVTDLNRNSALTAVLSASSPTNFNRFYRYRKPGVTTEYFLVENRQKTGRDAALPGAGIALWHIDEKGDRDDQRMATNRFNDNYEVTLEQADNQWHFQKNENTGDAFDLYYLGNTAAGYQNRFNDFSAPHARWWDGTESGVNFAQFSAQAETMTFQVVPAKPVILVQPVALTVLAGSNAIFSVTAVGAAPLSYAWRLNGVGLANDGRITGAATSSLTVSQVSPGDQGAYAVALSNPAGATNSLEVQLVVNVPPAITRHPLSVAGFLGGEAAFSVEASSPTPLAYRWQFNGSPLAGGTSSALLLTNIQQTAAGAYRVVVSNAFGALTSAVATLAIEAPLPAPAVLAQRAFGGSGDDAVQFVRSLADGGCLLGGGTTSPSSGNKSAPAYGGQDGWVARFAPGGSKLWDTSLGGDGPDQLLAALPLADGGCVLAGVSASDVSGNKQSPGWGGDDGWLVRLSASGARLWDASFGGLSYDAFACVLPDTNGGFLLAGSSASSDWFGNKTSYSFGGSDYWLVRVDAAGALLWENAYGGNHNDTLAAAARGADGGFLLAGISLSEPSGYKFTPFHGLTNATGDVVGADLWVLRLDAEGVALWDAGFGGSDDEVARGVCPTPEGGCLLGGSSRSGISGNKTNAPLGGWDVWLVRLDASGAELWQRAFGGAGDDRLAAFQPAPGGGWLLAIASNSRVSATKSATGYGGDDFWVLRLDENGRRIWDKVLGGTGNDLAMDLQPRADGGFLLAGWSDSGVSGSKTLGGFGGGDAWMVQLDSIAPRFARPGLAAGQVQLSFASEAGRAYRIQASTNLVHWTDVAATSLTNGTVQFTQPHQRRAFYRAVAP